MSPLYVVRCLTPLSLMCFLAFCLEAVAQGQQPEPTHPRSFVTILEEERDGSLQDRSSAGRFSIVDRRAIIHVRFDRQKLQAALVDKGALQTQLDDLSDDYFQSLQTLQRDIQQDIQQQQLRQAQGDITREALERELAPLRLKLQNIRELQVAEVEQIFLDDNSFQLSVVARVAPVDGAPFDLSVEGYTDVRLTRSTVSAPSATAAAETGTSQNTAADAAPTLRSVVTSTNIRPYRYEPRWDGQRLEVVLVNDVQDAVIQLPSDQLEDGDRIEITVVNYGPQRPRSYTWHVEVRDLGATLRTDPTLLLVQRTTAAGSNNEAPSDYKPAPGTSFVWEVKTRKEWWNSLDFRFGVNGSFVDFRSDKDFEVGVGPVVSFANGLVQLTYGWNLHAGGQPYWALGLGFLDIKERVAELGR